MKINIHGTSHEMLGIKNQDSLLELVNDVTGEKVKLVCDGCTNINPDDTKTFSRTHSEVGSGLFCSLYEMLDNPFDADSFEKNANEIMGKMLSLIGFSKEKMNDDLSKLYKINDFISHNYCFTIFACFETKDSFVVYHLGDGVILTVNHFGVVIYIERKYGNKPPYLVYNYINDFDKKFSFTKFVFEKEDFKNVGIASDGIQSILGKSFSDYEKRNVDKIFDAQKDIFYIPEEELKKLVKRYPLEFSDDVTVVW